MKILLDENLPLNVNYDLGKSFIVSSVKEMGWSGLKNGKLLQLAVENEFQVMITMDRNIKNQQNLALLNIAIIILIAKDNRVDTVSKFIPKIKTLLEKGIDKNIVEIN